MCFTPFHDQNAYISLMREAINLTNYELFKGESRIYSLLKCNVFHFNWDIHVSLSTPNAIKRKIKYLKWLLMIYAIRFKSGKIIFTLHDKMSHEHNKRYTEIEIIRSLIMRAASRIIIHSTESISVIKNLNPDIDMNKIVYIPHPNYLTAYTNTKPYTNYVKREGELVLLFMGLVRPYKNIEMIIKVANQLYGMSDIHFLICGRGNEEYQNQLLSMIESSNITADFRYIDDSEIPSLLELSDALITPYNTESALNSGAANLAFSFGRTVIGTWTGTTRDVDESLVYCYDYTDDESEHVLRLKNAILRFYNDFKRDSESVKAKGEKLREIMITEHSLEKVAEGLSKAYA